MRVRLRARVLVGDGGREMRAKNKTVRRFCRSPGYSLSTEAKIGVCAECSFAGEQTVRNIRARSLSDLLINAISSSGNFIGMAGICLDSFLKRRSALRKPDFSFDFPSQRGGLRSLSGGAVCIAAEITSEIRTSIQGPTNSYAVTRQGSRAASCMPWMIFLSGGQNVASAPLSRARPSTMK